MDVFGLLCATGGSEATEDVEPMANKKTKCDAHPEVKSDFEGFCREGRIFVFKKGKRNNS